MVVRPTWLTSIHIRFAKTKHANFLAPNENGGSPKPKKSLYLRNRVACEHFEWQAFTNSVGRIHLQTICDASNHTHAFKSSVPLNPVQFKTHLLSPIRYAPDGLTWHCQEGGGIPHKVCHSSCWSWWCGTWRRLPPVLVSPNLVWWGTIVCHLCSLGWYLLPSSKNSNFVKVFIHRLLWATISIQKNRSLDDSCYFLFLLFVFILHRNVSCSTTMGKTSIGHCNLLLEWLPSIQKGHSGRCIPLTCPETMLLW